MMDAIVCCADRFICVKALDYLKKNNITVRYCVVDFFRTESRVPTYCEKNNIPYVESNRSSEVINTYKDERVDLLISFKHQRYISMEMIRIGKCSVNFHTAPLPEFRGHGVTSVAMMQGVTDWGATCHFLDEHFDAGNIIMEKKVVIDKEEVKTGHDLSVKGAYLEYELFKEFINKVVTNGIEFESREQGEGHYYSGKYLESLKEIREDDDIDTIDKKIMALWYPPYGGAYIYIKGKKYYLINDDILKICADLYLEHDEAIEVELD